MLGEPFDGRTMCVKRRGVIIQGSPGLMPLIGPGVCAQLKIPALSEITYPVQSQLPYDESKWAVAAPKVLSNSQRHFTG